MLRSAMLKFQRDAYLYRLKETLHIVKLAIDEIAQRQLFQMLILILRMLLEKKLISFLCKQEFVSSHRTERGNSC